MPYMAKCKHYYKAIRSEDNSLEGWQCEYCGNTHPPLTPTQKREELGGPRGLVSTG